MSAAIAFEKIPREVISLCRRLVDAGHEAHLVGGGVRDLLLDRAVHDWDVTTSALPEEVQAIFRRTVPVGIRHGTVVVMLSRRQVEVTTYRGEGAYSDGRRPDEVVFIKSLEEDLKRRDFTMNAIAIDPLRRRLIDPMRGQADLERGLIRAVGSAGERLAEDGLRAMRAVRFAATLEFSLHPDTAAAIVASGEALARISRERIRDELLKLLAAPRPSRGLELMRETSLLSQVLPELLRCVGQHQNRFHLEDVYAHSLAACDATRGGTELRLAALLHDLGKPAAAAPHPDREGEWTFHGHEVIGAELAETICGRLKLPGAVSRRICHLVRHHNFLCTGWSGAALRRFIRRVGEDHIADVFALRHGDLAAREGAPGVPDQESRLQELEQMRGRIEQILLEKTALSVGDLAIDGRDVMRRLGIEGGPIVGEILRAILEAVLDDPSLNEAPRLLTMVEELASERPSIAGAGSSPPGGDQNNRGAR